MSLLEDIEYSIFIKNIINRIKERYIAPIYNLENIDDIPNSDL